MPLQSQNTLAMILRVFLSATNLAGAGEFVCFHWQDCLFISGVWYETHVSSPLTIRDKNTTLKYELH